MGYTLSIEPAIVDEVSLPNNYDEVFDSIVIWAMVGGEKLSDKALPILQDSGNGFYLSAASAWEVAARPYVEGWRPGGETDVALGQVGLLHLCALISGSSGFSGFSGFSGGSGFSGDLQGLPLSNSPCGSSHGNFLRFPHVKLSEL